MVFFRITELVGLYCTDMSAHKHAQETPWNTSYVNASVLKKKKHDYYGEQKDELKRRFSQSHIIAIVCERWAWGLGSGCLNS